jgi:hypothetical protein
MSQNRLVQISWESAGGAMVGDRTVHTVSGQTWITTLAAVHPVLSTRRPDILPRGKKSLMRLGKVKRGSFFKLATIGIFICLTKPQIQTFGISLLQQSTRAFLGTAGGGKNSSGSALPGGGGGGGLTFEVLRWGWTGLSRTGIWCCSQLHTQ